MISIQNEGKGCKLTFTKAGSGLFLGRFRPEKIIEATVKRFHDRIKISICYESSDEEKCDLDRGRILGIDPGVKNFAAVCNNFGATPFMINGGRICSLNQYYNKKKAAIQEKLIKEKSQQRLQSPCCCLANSIEQFFGF